MPRRMPCYKPRFEVDPQRVKKASEMFVERRTHGIQIIPQKVVYTISYKPWQGIYYIHHIRGDLSFKVKRRRLLSASPQMQIWFEMITCKVDTEQVTAFPGQKDYRRVLSSLI